MDNFDLLGRWREDSEAEDIGELLESEESEEKEDGMYVKVVDLTIFCY